MEIFRFEEFVSIEHQKIIMDFSINNPDWSPIKADKKFSSQQKNMINRSGDNSHLSGLDEVVEILDEYSHKIAQLLHEKGLLGNKIFSSPPTLFKYKKGYSLVPHLDTKYSKWIDYASVLYFNEDYSGGELAFPILDIEILPKPRELILFTQKDETYLHEVKRVTDGTRYSSATWWGSTGSDQETLVEYTFDD